VLLVLDPVPTLAVDLRALPAALAQPLFVEAVRPLRGLTHTPEGAWEAYREGRCLPGEARAIEAALIERFAREPNTAGSRASASPTRGARGSRPSS
jgi:hypothetical protein